MPKGRCTNFDKPCPKHVDEEVIEVPQGADFVCPECGRELMALSGGESLSERIVAAASDGKTLAAGAVAIVLLGIGGWMLTGSGSESSGTQVTTNRPDQKPTCGVEEPIQVQVGSDFAGDVDGKRVVVQFAVNREGNVLEPRVADGSKNQLLGQEAVDAVSNLDCKPGMKGGEPSKMTAELPVIFQKEEPQITRRPDCGVEDAVQHQVGPDFAADVRGERVVVRFAVSREGNVLEPRVAGGSENRLLGKEAVDAVSKLDCNPGMKGGEPAEMTTELPVILKKPKITREADCGGKKAVQNQVEYPDFAEKARIEGRVVVKFAVDEKGEVVNPKVADGSENQLLRQAAVDAVNKLSCKPALENGNPARMEKSLPVVFQVGEP